MQTPFIKSIAATAFAVCLIAGTASAQGKGHDKDKGDDKHHADDQHRAQDQQHQDQQHQDDKHRADNQHLASNDAHRDMGRPISVNTSHVVYRKVPPGLAKKGGLPPGQAKKYYHTADGIPAMRDVFTHHGYTVVRTQPYGNSQYVYYRQANGPLQRAVILPGTSQLNFQNVPASLVQEILARLY